MTIAQGYVERISDKGGRGGKMSDSKGKSDANPRGGKKKGRAGTQGAKVLNFGLSKEGEGLWG